MTMRRAWRWTWRVGLGLVGLIVLAVGVLVLVLHTDWGRERLRRRAIAALHDTFPHCVRIGKVSFGAEKLRENARALLELLLKLKPQTAKGQYVRSIAVSTTLGPGIKIDVNEVQQELTAK